MRGRWTRFRPSDWCGRWWSLTFAGRKGNPDYEVTVQDVAAWEQAHGTIPAGAVVMAYTGWDERWNSHQSSFATSGAS
jgi:kynurenine formamidase